eukprot:TRINITY_DN816_c2_g1_i1.p1 TRINITY_DN816_c2_g1~~TRINITY_DN816_c2_g1_i1.p1  ORF type:complete len:504 (-),score=158.26 TRINITY_DN816_c2_g1_i1:9-1520(-)
MDRRDSCMTMKLCSDPVHPDLFLAAFEVGGVHQYDLRSPEIDTHKIKVKTEANAVAFHPSHPHLFSVGFGDSIVATYDNRMVGDDRDASIYQFAPAHLLSSRRKAICGLSINRKDQIVASYLSDDIYLFDCPLNSSYSSSSSLTTDDNGGGGSTTSTSSSKYDIITTPLQTYSGHRNVQTFLKEVAYIGRRGEYIMSGSDCGHLFIWDTRSGDIVHVLSGDRSVVNGAAAHPQFPAMICTWGIESTVKIWDSIGEKSTVDQQVVTNIIDRNMQRQGSMLQYAQIKTMIANSRRKRRDLKKQQQQQPTSSSSENSSKPAESSSSSEDDEDDDDDEDDFYMWNPFRRPDLPAMIISLKEEGNKLFREGLIHESLAMYSKACEIGTSTNVERMSAQSVDRFKQLIRPILLNKAACNLVLKEYKAVIEDSTKALDGDPLNLKGLFRRGRAYFFINDFDNALVDLQKFVENSPEEEQSAQKIIQQIQRAIAQRDKREASLFQRMFKKE